MKFQKLSVGLAAATLTLSLSTAWAQDDRGRPRESEPAASRPSNGDNVGSAVPRGGGGGSDTTSSPASSTSSSTPSNNSPANPAGSSTSWMDSGSSGASRRAPVRPERADRLDAADQRRGNGGQATGHAVPRSESGNTGSGSPSATSSSSGSENQPAQAQGHSRSVPPNSRPRDGRNQTGTAVERVGVPPNGDGHYGYPGYGYGYYPSYVYDPFYSFYYSPYYNGYGYWNPYGYGYGLGYFSYDPFLFGALGYPGYGGGGGGYSASGGYPESSGGGSYVPHYQGAGSLRLKIKPADAKVYIDGYFVGMVDSFDGVFQKLNVDAGPHKVELRADGYETSEFEVVVTPGDTVTYKGDMKRR